MASRSKRKWPWVFASGMIGAVGAAAAIITISQAKERADRPRVSGEWHLRFVVEETSYHPFEGLETGYRIFLTQDGSLVVGEAEKVTENGSEVPSGRLRLPLTLQATIDGTVLEGTYRLEGTARTSVGTLRMTIADDARSMAGSFMGTAAQSSGSVVALRRPD